MEKEGRFKKYGFDFVYILSDRPGGQRLSDAECGGGVKGCFFGGNPRSPKAYEAKKRGVFSGTPLFFIVLNVLFSPAELYKTEKAKRRLKFAAAFRPIAANARQSAGRNEP